MSTTDVSKDALAPESEAGELPPGAESEEKQGGFSFPSAYTILFLLIIVFTILTWVIPAGKYNVDVNGNLVPNTYHEVARNGQKFFTGSLTAPVNGMYGIQDAAGTVSPYNLGVLYGAIDVALFILVIGGFLGITMKTGAMDAGIAAVVRSLGTRGNLLVPLLMVIFMAGGTTYGMAEESLAFYTLIIAAMIALGYDALTGVAVIMLGAGIGVVGSTINPFSVGIASGFAGIPLGDGIVYRIAILVLGGAAGIWWVMRYANRVKADPEKSLVASKREDNARRFLHTAEAAEAPELTTRRKWVLVLFGLTFALMIYGVVPWSDFGIHRIVTRFWWFPELTALFLFASIVVGVVGGMGEAKLTENFIDGARDMLGVALVVALARGISVIMTNGLITDTVLHWCEQALGGLGTVAFVNSLFALFIPLGFLIPSSSGLATLTMPIMAPLASFNGIPENLVVTGYASASGLINLVSPTFAVVVGGLAIGRVPLNTWWRFSLPLVAILVVIVVAVLTVGALIG